MGLDEFLLVVRRRWKAILLLVILGGAAAIVTTPDKPNERVRYKAIATVAVLRSSGQTAGVALEPVTAEIAAALATQGEVPSRVANRLGFLGEPQVLAQQVTAKANSQPQTVDITATNADGEQAARVANTFASELIAVLEERRTGQLNAAIDAAQRQANELQTKATELDAKILANKPPDADPIRAERASVNRDLGSLTSRLQQLGNLQGPAAARVTLIRQAVPIREVRSGVRPPSALVTRLAIAAGLALVLGIGLAIFIERAAPGVRSKRQAEMAFSLPVLAEIPHVRMRRKRMFHVLTNLAPQSPVAEAYRNLRSAAVLMPPSTALDAKTVESNGHGNSGRTLLRGQRVILVTSAEPAEGKTSVVANLAVSFAEIGKEVLVVSGDLRRPTLHRYFDVDNDRGMSNTDASTVGSLRGVAQPTNTPRVSLVPSGPPSVNPAVVLSTYCDLIAGSRDEADVVIVDTPPLLVANDTRELLAAVDAVILVAREGKTTMRNAARVTETLYRLNVPLLGVALNRQGGVPRHHKRYYRPVSLPLTPVPNGTEAPEVEPSVSADEGSEATVEAPDPVTVEAPDPVTVEAPDLETVEGPDEATVGEPDLATVEEPDPVTVEEPVAQPVGAPARKRARRKTPAKTNDGDETHAGEPE